METNICLIKNKRFIIKLISCFVGLNVSDGLILLLWGKKKINSLYLVHYDLVISFMRFMLFFYQWQI